MTNVRSGFTLIELLVVIAIIGILSSVVMASLNSAREKSRDVRRAADLSSLALALELYFDDAGKYPDPDSLSADLTPDYISTIPVDPLDDTIAYNYAAPDGGGTVYHLAADLESADTSLLDADAGCSSVATLVCFSTALDQGFDGDTPVAGRGSRLDRKN